MEFTSLEHHSDDYGNPDDGAAVSTTRDHSQEDQCVAGPGRVFSLSRRKRYRSSKPHWWEGRDGRLQEEELRPRHLQRPSKAGLRPTLFPALAESVLHLQALEGQRISISTASTGSSPTSSTAISTFTNASITSTAISTSANTAMASSSCVGTVSCSPTLPAVSNPATCTASFPITTVASILVAAASSPTVIDTVGSPTTSHGASHLTSSTTLRPIVSGSSVNISTLDSAATITGTNATAHSSGSTSAPNTTTLLAEDSIIGVASTSTAVSTIANVSTATAISTIAEIPITTTTFAAPTIPTTIVGTSVTTSIATITTTASNVAAAFTTTATAVVPTTITANFENSNPGVAATTITRISNNTTLATASATITGSPTNITHGSASTTTTIGARTSTTSANTASSSTAANNAAPTTTTTTAIALLSTVAEFPMISTLTTSPMTYASFPMSKGNTSNSSVTCTSSSFLSGCCSPIDNSSLSSVVNSIHSSTSSNTMTGAPVFSIVNVSNEIPSIADKMDPPVTLGSSGIAADTATSTTTTITTTSTTTYTTTTTTMTTTTTTMTTTTTSTSTSTSTTSTSTTTISTSLSPVSSSPGLGMSTPCTTITATDPTTAIVPHTIISVMASSSKPLTCSSSSDPPPVTPLRRILTRSQTGTTVGGRQSRVLKLATTYPRRNRQPKRPHSRNSDSEDYIPPSMCRSRSHTTSRTSMVLASLPFTSPRSSSSRRTATVVASTPATQIKSSVQTFTRDIDPSNEFLYVKNPSGTGIEFGNMCGECGVVTVTSIAFKRHCEAHGDAGFACGFCPHVFLTAAGQERHMELHHNGAHLDVEDYSECGICGGSFIAVMYLEFHILELHGEDNLKIRAHEVILVGQTYSRHNISDSGQGEGEVGVGVRQVGRGGDKDKMDDETEDEDNEDGDEQPYRCGICAMHFSYSLNLDCHMVLHAEVSYMCATCHTAFPSLDPLTLHVKTICSRRRPILTQSSPDKQNHSDSVNDANHKDSMEVLAGVASPTSSVVISSTTSSSVMPMPTSAAVTTSTSSVMMSTLPSAIMRPKPIAHHHKQQKYPKVEEQEVEEDNEEERHQQLLLLHKEQEDRILQHHQLEHGLELKQQQQQQHSTGEAAGSSGDFLRPLAYTKPMNSVHTLPSTPFWNSASAYPSGLNPVLAPTLTPVGGSMTPGLAPVPANIPPSLYNYYMMMSVWPNAGPGVPDITALSGEVAKASAVHPEVRRQQQHQQQYLDSLGSSGSNSLYAGNSVYSPGIWPPFFSPPLAPVFGCGPYMGETGPMPPPPHTPSHPHPKGSTKTNYTHEDETGSCHQYRKGSYINLAENEDVSDPISKDEECRPKQEIKHEGRQ